MSFHNPYTNIVSVSDTFRFVLSSYSPQCMQANPLLNRTSRIPSTMLNEIALRFGVQRFFISNNFRKEPKNKLEKV